MVSPEIMKKKFQRESKQKELGQISKDIRERNTRAPVLKATATVMCSDTGVTTILDMILSKWPQNQIAIASAKQKEKLSEQPPCYRILDTVLIIK